MPTSNMIAPQPFCLSCETAAAESGICPECDSVIDRDQFFAFYPDAPDTDWRPWMVDPEPETRPILVLDYTK